MYDAIYINQSKEWLLDFEGRVSFKRTWKIIFNSLIIYKFNIKDSLVALDFASELESSSFYKTATTTIANRSKRRQVTNSKFIVIFVFRF